MMPIIQMLKDATMRSKFCLVSKVEATEQSGTASKLYVVPATNEIEVDEYDTDPRVQDMTPVIKSMEFLMHQVDTNTPIHRLITQTFKMVLVAQDLIDNQIKAGSIHKS